MLGNNVTKRHKSDPCMENHGNVTVQMRLHSCGPSVTQTQPVVFAHSVLFWNSTQFLAKLQTKYNIPLTDMAIILLRHSVSIIKPQLLCIYM